VRIHKERGNFSSNIPITDKIFWQSALTKNLDLSEKYSPALQLLQPLVSKSAMMSCQVINRWRFSLLLNHSRGHRDGRRIKTRINSCQLLQLRFVAMPTHGAVGAELAIYTSADWPGTDVSCSACQPSSGVTWIVLLQRTELITRDTWNYCGNLYSPMLMDGTW